MTKYMSNKSRSFLPQEGMPTEVEQKPCYVRVPITWQVLSTTGPGIETTSVRHEVSQALLRPLGEFSYKYHIHRFTLSNSSALNSQLLQFSAALQAEDAGVKVSNVGGGYHSKRDLFKSSDILELRYFSVACGGCSLNTQR